MKRSEVSWTTVAAIAAWFLVPAAGRAAGEADGSVGRYAHYAVAADRAAASRVGARILENGGNAADAAAATMLALGVVNPASSGLGGGGFALYWDAEDEELHLLDFREEAPAAATADMYTNAEGGTGPLSAPSQLGGLASGVPGEPAGIDALIERFGDMPRRRLVDPALKLATEGFDVSPYLAELSETFASQMKHDAVMRQWFASGTDALRAGQTLKRPALARTLRAFARAGAQAIYEGPLARRIARASREHGGIMRPRDLKAYEVVAREPLRAERFGLEWATAPLPSAGGFTMLQSLALLERWRPHWEARNGTGAPGGQLRTRPAWLHALAESWKGPFMDRASYAGDRDHVEVPFERMMAPARMDRRARVFHPTLALAPQAYEVPIPGYERPEGAQPTRGGTSHLCVVDEDGNVASVTTTVNLPFGARYTAAGMVMNDELDDFARSGDATNAFGLPGAAANLPGPGRRPVSTMSPTILFRDGQPVLCVGAAGGSKIVTAIEQVAFRIAVLGMDAGAAVRAPRIHHQGQPNVLRTEPAHPMPSGVVEALRARGHAHDKPSYGDHLAVTQAIQIRPDRSPRLIAVSDPRKGGHPAGE